jgi:hypothetical protein
MPDSWERLFERASEHDVAIDTIQSTLAEQRTNEERHDG